jgi:hypothetical protein
MPAKVGSKIILGILFVFLIAGVVLTLALQQPRFAANTALYLLKKSHSNIVYKEITVEKIHWFSWDKVDLENVRIKCKINGESYYFSTGKVVIDNVKALVGNAPLLLHINNLAVISDQLNISDIEIQSKIYFEMFHYQRLEVIALMSRLEWNQYLFENVKGLFKDNGHQLNFTDIQAHFYGGNIHLDGWMSYVKEISYHMDIQLNDVNSFLLAKVNPNFGQLTAVIEGTVKLENSKLQGMMIQAALQAPAGGSMKASLLKYLAQYVPQRQQVEDLISKDAQVDLTKIQANVLSLDREKISSEVILNSSSLNLNMDVKFDINIEGGIAGLLEYSTHLN